MPRIIRGDWYENEPTEQLVSKRGIEERIARRKAAMSKLGKLGGASKSERKLAAVRENLKKARALRWLHRLGIQPGEETDGPQGS